MIYVVYLNVSYTTDFQLQFVSMGTYNLWLKNEDYHIIYLTIYSATTNKYFLLISHIHA